jgi:ABC-type spermidine/putrescine transport system permease subunit I
VLLAFFLAFFLACLILLRYSLNDWDPVRTTAAGCTATNCRTVLGDPFYLRVLDNTLKVGSIVACCLPTPSPTRTRRRGENSSSCC